MYFFIPKANMNGVITSVVGKIVHTIRIILESIVKDDFMEGKMVAH